MRNGFWKSFSCVQCGYCCKKATCSAGLLFGANPQNCKFLKGKRPGEYICLLVENKAHPDIKNYLGIGEGCCEPLNTDRSNLIVKDA